MDSDAIATDAKEFNRRETLFLTGTLTALVGAALYTPAHADEKPPEISDLAATDLVGYQLRVVGPNDMVTQEFNAGRITIAVDAEKRITHIQIG